SKAISLPSCLPFSIRQSNEAAADFEKPGTQFRPGPISWLLPNCQFRRCEVQTNLSEPATTRAAC
ncbi:hypothetical protein K0M31_005013, partial [Melipona bicolor]